MNKRCTLLIILLLGSVLLLQGCLFAIEATESLPQTIAQTSDISPSPDAPVRSPAEPGQFTIRYVPDSTINPITCLSRDNIVLSSLLYESLFTLDANLNVEPVLCDDWSTDDFITYVFVLKHDIAMSDGSYLTADDVVYTIRQAMQRGRFVNRLSTIRSIVSDDDLTVTITLNSANNKFIRLLDVPIIKTGSIDNMIPPGTGPYVFAGPGIMRLERFSGYRDFAKLPVIDIHLLECNDNEIAELFDSGVLSLLWDDPSDTFDVILNRHNEARGYDTTTLQFIGFNTRSIILRDEDVRRAIGSSINRQHIIDTIIPGQPLAAPLALPSTYRLYDSQWEQTDVDPLREMSVLLSRAGLEDHDNDSFLDYPDGFGGFHKISLNFIVNSENTYKVNAAHRFSDTLRLYGIEIIVRELPWESFLAALETGFFDLYYGEIALGADFDLSPLLMPNSHLNYGLTGSDTYRPFIEDFLSAQTDFEEHEAAQRLCDRIRLDAPFIPILYKRYVVHTPIGAISGAIPSQSGVFNNFADWTIDLTMIP